MHTSLNWIHLVWTSSVVASPGSCLENYPSCPGGIHRARPFDALVSGWVLCVWLGGGAPSLQSPWAGGGSTGTAAVFHRQNGAADQIFTAPNSQTHPKRDPVRRNVKKTISLRKSTAIRCIWLPQYIDGETDIARFASGPLQRTYPVTGNKSQLMDARAPWGMGGLHLLPVHVAGDQYRAWKGTVGRWKSRKRHSGVAIKDIHFSTISETAK